MSIQDISAGAITIATIINVFVTIYLAYATKRTAEAAKAAAEGADKQLQWTKVNSRGDFLLRVDEAFLHREDVRAKLAGGGDWHRRKNDPTFPKGPNYKLSEDLTAVNSYLGIFERIKHLMDGEIITINIVDDWYGDRIFNIVINEHIERRLLDYKDRWKGFIDLWSALEAKRRKEGRGWLPGDRPHPDDKQFAHINEGQH